VGLTVVRASAQHAARQSRRAGSAILRARVAGGRRTERRLAAVQVDAVAVQMGRIADGRRAGAARALDRRRTGIGADARTGAAVLRVARGVGLATVGGGAIVVIVVATGTHTRRIDAAHDSVRAHAGVVAVAVVHAAALPAAAAVVGALVGVHLAAVGVAAVVVAAVAVVPAGVALVDHALLVFAARGAVNDTAGVAAATAILDVGREVVRALTARIAGAVAAAVLAIAVAATVVVGAEGL